MEAQEINFSHAIKTYSLRVFISSVFSIESQMLLLNMQMMVMMIVVSCWKKIGWTWLARQKFWHELNVGYGESEGLDSW